MEGKYLTLVLPLHCPPDVPVRDKFFGDEHDAWTILANKHLHPSTIIFCLSVTNLLAYYLPLVPFGGCTT